MKEDSELDGLVSVTCSFDRLQAVIKQLVLS